jgi:hypothetical protein
VCVCVSSECVCVCQQRESVCVSAARKCVCVSSECVRVCQQRVSVCVSAARVCVCVSSERECQQAPKKDFTLGAPQTVHVELASVSWGRGDRFRV